MIKKFLFRTGTIIFSFTLLGFSLYFLFIKVKEYSLANIIKNLTSIPLTYLAAAFLFAFISYLITSRYDYLAFKHLKRDLPNLKVTMASFISYAFSYNFGFGAIIGTSLRYYFYTHWGISIADITRIVVFSSICVWVGILSLAGTIFIIEPVAHTTLPLLKYILNPYSGFFLLALTFIYIILCYKFDKPFIIKNHEIKLPSLKMAFIQISLGLFDWMATGAILYSLITPFIHIPFFAFLQIYLIAQISAMVSQIPGGIGIFDTVIIYSLSKHTSADILLGSLIAYRTIFYLIPFIIAIIIFFSHEIYKQDKPRFRRYAEELSKSLKLKPTPH